MILSVQRIWKNLYQKNNHLLSKLSSKDRTNTILQTELCSLIEKQSRLGLKNNTLKTEVDSLKKTLTHFKNQERKFYEQSFRLKDQLKNLQISEGNSNSSKRRLLKEREKAFSEKLVRFLRYRQKVKQAHYHLKKKQMKQQEKIKALEHEINQISKNGNYKPSGWGGDFQYSRVRTLQKPQYDKQSNSLFQIEAMIKQPVSQNESRSKLQIKAFQDNYIHLKKQLQTFEKNNLNYQDQIKFLKKQQEEESRSYKLKKEKLKNWLKHFSSSLEKIQNFKEETLRLQKETQDLKQAADAFKKENQNLKQENWHP